MRLPCSGTGGVFRGISKNPGFFYRLTKDANVDPTEVAKNGGFRDTPSRPQRKRYDPEKPVETSVGRQGRSLKRRRRVASPCLPCGPPPRQQRVTPPQTTCQRGG